MAKVTSINSVPTPEEIDAEWHDSADQLLLAFDHMVSVQGMCERLKGEIDNALAKAEKWWRYEAENRQRLREIKAGGKYVKRPQFNNIKQGPESLTEFETTTQEIVSAIPETQPIETETEKDGE